MSTPEDDEQSKPIMNVRVPYKGFGILVRVFEHSERDFYSVAFIQKSPDDSTAMKRFLVEGRFESKHAALERALSDSKEKIDSGFDPNSFE